MEPLQASNYILYCETIITKKIGDKFGHIRRQVIGARVHYSARGVIVPIIYPHQSDEIHLSWKIGINILKNEILNVLMNREGYSLNDALYKFMKSLSVYDKHIHNIANMLIKECPYKGLPVLNMGRIDSNIYNAHIIELLETPKAYLPQHKNEICLSVMV